MKSEEDVISYFDEILTVHIPDAIEAAGLEVYEMPNFSYNYQNRSHDGRATNGKIYYHTGNLTGIQTVYRDTCSEPSWTFGNVTAKCVIIFPQITIKYEARLQIMSFLSNGAHSNIRANRHLDFNVTGDIIKMKAELEITASPYLKTPTVKRFVIKENGAPLFRFSHVEDLPYEIVSEHFYHKFNEIFHEVFSDVYGPVFGKAVASISYPFQ